MEGTQFTLTKGDRVGCGRVGLGSDWQAVLCPCPDRGGLVPHLCSPDLRSADPGSLCRGHDETQEAAITPQDCDALTPGFRATQTCCLMKGLRSSSVSLASWWCLSSRGKCHGDWRGPLSHLPAKSSNPRNQMEPQRSMDPWRSHPVWLFSPRRSPRALGCWGPARAACCSQGVSGATITK